MSGNGYEGLAEGPSTEDLKRLATLAQQMWDAERAVEKAEEAFKQRKEELARIREVEIPELMDACGCKEYVTKTGLKLTVADFVRAAITEENNAAAIAWLDKHGHSGLIKRSLLLEFPKEQEKKARALAAKLREQFPNLLERNTVHPQTLMAFIRAELAEGHEIPMALFSAEAYKKASVKAVAEKKNPIAAG